MRQHEHTDGQMKKQSYFETEADHEQLKECETHKYTTYIIILTRVHMLQILPLHTLSVVEEEESD